MAITTHPEQAGELMREVERELLEAYPKLGSALSAARNLRALFPDIENRELAEVEAAQVRLNHALKAIESSPGDPAGVAEIEAARAAYRAACERFYQHAFRTAKRLRNEGFMEGDQCR
ncbi:MAG: hypothetical protein HY650_16675 [Acidobacteria bacterium]|nr:hypothetical protein [Acidobacteriota bacterium]